MEPSTDVIFGAATRTTNARVTCVFGPQHGYHQTEQDNMIETPDTTYTYTAKDTSLMAVNDKKVDSKSLSQSVPLFSLYSATRMPTDEQVHHITHNVNYRNHLFDVTLI